MSTILLENYKRNKNLFNIIFGTLDLTSDNKINYLLSTDEIKTTEMLDEINNILSHKYGKDDINNIFINHKIITNRNSPKFQ